MEYAIHWCEHHGYHTKSDNLHRRNVAVSGVWRPKEPFSRRVYDRLSSPKINLDGFLVRTSL